MKRVGVCVLAAMAAVLPGGAWAVNDASVPPAAPRPGFFAASAVAGIKPTSIEQRDERRFLKDAAAASRFEGEAARMALDKTKDAGVRSFATALKDHHSAATATLQHLLHVRGMAPPMLDNDHRKTLNRLSKLRGTKFDRAFIDEVGLRQQHQDVQQYEKAALTSSDPALKAWVGNTLPELRGQLATAERLARPGSSRLTEASSR